jgi:hypothetical protein
MKGCPVLVALMEQRTAQLTPTTTTQWAFVLTYVLLNTFLEDQVRNSIV